MIAINWFATPHATPAASAQHSTITISTEGTLPSRAFSNARTTGERRKLKTTARARGMKIRRPKYSIAIVRATAINNEALEEEFWECDEWANKNLRSFRVNYG